MTNEEARKLLTVEQVIDAEATGKSWGEMEVECWKDQHEGSFDRAPEWTMGDWSGYNPIGNPADDEAAVAYDLIVDLAARDVWNDAE